MNIIDRKVLSLNRNWQVIGIRTVSEAFTAMMGGSAENPPAVALDISYPKDENGDYDFSQYENIVPLTWVEWMALPIREFDYVINTSKQKIRVPNVIVSVNYAKIPKRRPKPNLNTLYEMQQGRCGLTGNKISRKHANIEHKIPRSKGGRDTFENLMAVDKKVNSERGNKPYEEFGYVPLFNHKTPAPVPVQFTIKHLESPDWQWFMTK